MSKVKFKLEIINPTYEIDLSEYDDLTLEIWNSWGYEKKIEFLERDVKLTIKLRDLIQITEQN